MVIGTFHIQIFVNSPSISFTNISLPFIMSAHVQVHRKRFVIYAINEIFWLHHSNQFNNVFKDILTYRVYKSWHQFDSLIRSLVSHFTNFLAHPITKYHVECWWISCFKETWIYIHIYIYTYIHTYIHCFISWQRIPTHKVADVLFVCLDYAFLIFSLISHVQLMLYIFCAFLTINQCFSSKYPFWFKQN